MLAVPLPPRVYAQPRIQLPVDALNSTLHVCEFVQDVTVRSNSLGDVT